MLKKKKTAPEDEHKPTLPTGTHVFLKASLNLQTLNQSKKKKKKHKLAMIYENNSFVCSVLLLVTRRIKTIIRTETR